MTVTEHLRSAVFLDRDGVINDRRLLLVRKLHHFRFAKGALDALVRLSKSPHAIVVVTNQPAVGSGFLERDELALIHHTMVREVEEAGGRIDRVYACLFTSGEDPGCRKPSPGMLLDAAADLDLDLSRSWMVGDTWKDVVAGRAAGCRTVLVNPSLPTRFLQRTLEPDAYVRDLSVAVDYIMADPESHPERPSVP